MKEPVIRLNKEMRAEILGNVLKDRFNGRPIRRKIATEAFTLLQVKYQAFRATLAPIIQTHPTSFNFHNDSFTITRPRQKNGGARQHDIYTVDFLDAQQLEEYIELKWHERDVYLNYTAIPELFEGLPEIVPVANEEMKVRFKGFVMPGISHEIPKDHVIWGYVNELVELKKDKEKLSAQTSAVLNSCYTMKQLVETWPNVVEYAPTIVPSPTGTSLVLRVEDIDALIQKGNK